MNDRLVTLIDMDCFYCQVETRLNPSLNGKPMAVVQYNQWKGGGIIAVNYEARDRGVTRHMRGEEARKHCPEIQLVSVPSVRGKADLTKYRDAGREVVKVICEFSDCVQRASVDEAYVDLTEAVEKRLTLKTKVSPVQMDNTFVVGYSSDNDNNEVEREEGVACWLEEVYGSELVEPSLHRLATAAALVEEIRAAVFNKTGFRCSAGIAHNKILAKLVCGLHKPNRQTVLPLSSVARLYQTLPVKKVRNLGGKFGDDVVERLGITYMGELANFTEKQLQARYDDKTGTWLYNLGRGVDLEVVTPRLVSKSIGCCKKFPGKTALRSRQSVTHWLSELAAEVAERLEEDIHMNKRKAQTLTIHFSQEIDKKDVAVSRSVPLPSYEAEKIAACAFCILSKNSTESDDIWSPPLKYLGLSAGKFIDYSGNTSTSIDKFFKTVTTNTSSKEHDLATEDKAPEDIPHTSTSKDINDKENSLQSLNNESNKSKKSSKGSEKCGRKVSFFEKYFKNQPNKIIKSSPLKQSTCTEVSVENQVMINRETGDTLTCIVSDEHTSCNEKIEQNILQVKLNSESRFEQSGQNGDDSNWNWISPSEIFPDIQSVDDSLIGILPSPLQRQIQIAKNKLFSECKTTVESGSGAARLSTDSDCAPTRVETVVDIHSSQRIHGESSSSKYLLPRRLPREEELDDGIEVENLFDRTSLDVFELGSNEQEDENQQIISEMCSVCSESVPLVELQEHLDHHVAIELHQQLNQHPQTNRTMVSNQCKSDRTVVVSDKKKRGRPSKKEAIPAKKSRTIMSFFTKH